MRDTVEASDIVTASSSGVPDETGPDPRRWGILAVVIVAQLMIVLDASIVTIALPSAQHALHISTANRQWVITAYTLAFGGFLLLGGRIADFSGRKRMFVVGLLGFAGASALGWPGRQRGDALRRPRPAGRVRRAHGSRRPVHPDHHLPARRQGAGQGLRCLRRRLGRRRGDRSPARWRADEYASWRWCLLVNVPIAVLASVGAVLIVHESRASGSTKYDVPGALLSTLGLVSLVYGFTKAESDGWSATVTIVLLVVAVVLLAAFVILETKTATRCCHSGWSVTGTGAAPFSPPCSRAPGSSPCSSS